MKKFSLIVLAFLFFSSFSPALATISLQISNFKQINDYFSVDVLLSGAPADTRYYLQAMFTKAEPSNYLGFTWSQKGEWIKYLSADSSEKDFITENFPIIENDNTQVILIKPDPDDTGYKGPGEYLLKVKRYTSGGSSYFSDNSLTVTLNDPSPSPETTDSAPTPSATQSAAQSTTASPTPLATHTSTPTPTQTKTPTPTITPTQKQSSTPSPIVIISPQIKVKADLANPTASSTANLDSLILGESTNSADPSEILTTSPEIKEKSTGSSLNKVFIILGIILVAPAAALYFFIDRVKIS